MEPYGAHAVIQEFQQLKKSMFACSSGSFPTPFKQPSPIGRYPMGPSTHIVHTQAQKYGHRNYFEARVYTMNSYMDPLG